MQVSNGFDWFLLNISELIWLAAATAFALCTLFSFAFSFLTFPVLDVSQHVPQGFFHRQAPRLLRAQGLHALEHFVLERPIVCSEGVQVKSSPNSYRRTKRTRKSTWVIFALGKR